MLFLYQSFLVTSIDTGYFGRYTFIEVIQKMKRKLTISLLLLGIFVIPLFTACGPQTVYSRDKVLKYTDEFFEGKAELVREELLNETSGATRYVFKAPYGFEFTVLSTLYTGQPVAINSREIITDYSECMLKAYEERLSAAAAVRNVECSINTSTLKVSVNDFDALDDGIAFLTEVYEVLGEMLIDTAPDNNPMSFDPVRIRLMKDDVVILRDDLSRMFTGFDEEDEKYLNLCAKISFVHEAQNGNIQDFPVTEDIYSQIPREVIRELNINGKRFESEKYIPEFIYDARKNEYEVRVGYGIDIEYNGGVKDEMQREIVEKYLGGRYIIENDNHKTSYTIGSDSFRIKCPRNENGVEHTRCKFEKNGELLDIKACYEPQFWGHRKATYFFFLTLDDYAELLNMDYRVDNQVGIVYLTSRGD